MHARLDNLHKILPRAVSRARAHQKATVWHLAQNDEQEAQVLVEVGPANPDDRQATAEERRRALT